MKQPSLDLLMQHVDSKYTLVVAAAKRARALMEEQENEGLQKGHKAVSLALKEIADGKLRLERTSEGLK